MITAMHSGAGKTVMSCALMAALKNRGMNVQAFKCGPDYIDPMFHEKVLGVPCRNLDLFLQGEVGMKKTLFRSKAEIAILEAAMGYYDGIDGTDQASAWQIAHMTNTPVILVLRPKGSGLTLAAQVCGLMRFRLESNIRGVLLAECSVKQMDYLKPILERETGLPVLGFLPSMTEARIESRHLGLLTADEVQDFSDRLRKIVLETEKSIDLGGLLALAGEYRTGEERKPTKPRCRIAVAQDAAFCFCYADSLDALVEAGAELCFFSPLKDSDLPEEIDGLYLPGGYPELYAKTLSYNNRIRKQISVAVKSGLPTVAECGGLLYLQENLENEKGQVFPMCAVLPGSGYRTEKLQRFGYQYLKAEENSLLFRSGESVPVHEFHYWESTAPGTVFRSEKPNGKTWRCGYAGNSLYAAFPHLYFGGELPLAKRFVKACETWKASLKS